MYDNHIYPNFIHILMFLSLDLLMIMFITKIPWYFFSKNCFILEIIVISKKSVKFLDLSKGLLLYARNLEETLKNESLVSYPIVSII